MGPIIPATLGELVGTWNGMEIQALIRNVFRFLPWYVFIVSAMWHLNNVRMQRWIWSAWHPVVTYTVTSFALMIFFWPEALFIHSPLIGADDVRSAYAEADGGGVENAAQAAGGIQTTQPLLTNTLVRIVVDGPLRAARLIHEQALNPFPEIMPLNALLKYQLSANNLAALRNWTHECYIPAKTRVKSQGDGGASYQELLPFDSTPVADEMANMFIVPGRNYGIEGMLSAVYGFLLGQRVRCDTYQSRIEQRIFAQMNTDLSPSGRPLIAVWSERLDESVDDIIRLVFIREMVAAESAEIPTPSVIGTWAAVRGAQALGGAAAGSFTLPRRGGGLKNSLKSLGRGFSFSGLLLGLASAAGHQLNAAIDAVVSFLEPAIFMQIWGAELMGFIQMSLHISFPFVVVWSLRSRGHMMPILNWLGLMLVAYSTPLWFATAELWADSYGSFIPSPINDPLGWARMRVGVLVIQSLGVFVMAFVMASTVLIGAGAGGVAVVRLVRGRV